MDSHCIPLHTDAGDVTSTPLPTPQRTIYAITFSRNRSTQLLDLTSLCQTLSNVDNLVWIVVEMTTVKTPLVADLLSECKANSVHLVRNVTSEGDVVLRRGAREINAGLQWVRSQCRAGGCSGVVYLMEDESKYDLRLFDQVPIYMYMQYMQVYMYMCMSLLKDGFSDTSNHSCINNIYNCYTQYCAKYYYHCV